LISKTLGALVIDDNIVCDDKAEYKINKPRSRKSSEKENDGKTMNFGAIGNADITTFGIAPWKMETAKAMAILGMNF
jgi:hypothetical protein